MSERINPRKLSPRSVLWLQSTLICFMLSFTACGSGGGGGSDSNLGDVGKLCGGVQGAVCEQGLYCLFPNNTCGAKNTIGNCEILPEICADDFNPVCGCDGRVYSNGCQAAASGQSTRPIQFCKLN